MKILLYLQIGLDDGIEMGISMFYLDISDKYAKSCIIQYHR